MIAKKIDKKPKKKVEVVEEPTGKRPGRPRRPSVTT